MSNRKDERLASDLEAVAGWLRDHRHEASVTELDQIKVRALASGRRSRNPWPKGHLLMGRGLGTGLLLASVLVSGLIAAFAVVGGSGGGVSATLAQYATCGNIAANNDIEEQQLAAANAAEEANQRQSHRRARNRVKGKRNRKRLRRHQRKEERQLAAENDQEEAALAARNAAEEQACASGQLV